MSESAHLRVIIVDDEEPARMAVRHDLESLGGVTIVAECANGFEGGARGQRAAGGAAGGSAAAQRANAEARRLRRIELIGRDVPVIFITAYDEFALRAFEVHAVDYLLKPFARERLHEAYASARVRDAASRSARRPRSGRGRAARPNSSRSRSPRHPRRPERARRSGRED